MGIREDLDILGILDWRVYGSIFGNRSNLKAIPAVKHTKKHQTTFGKSPFSMAKSTISKSPFSIAKRQVTLPARLILKKIGDPNDLMMKIEKVPPHLGTPFVTCFYPIQLWPFISYNWLFQWDYTCYKWGFLSTCNWYNSGHNCRLITSYN